MPSPVARTPEAKAQLAQGAVNGRYTRVGLTNDIVAGMVRAWRRHGDKALDRLARTSPAMFVKMAVLLVPREHKIEHTNTYEGLTTEQIQQYIAAIQDRIDRAAGKLIDADPPKLEIPEPGDPGHKDGIWAHAATSVVTEQRKRRRSSP